MSSPAANPAHETAASSDMARARALVERLHAAGLRSTSELLHELRREFPNAPLAVRVGALNYIPR